VDHRDVNQNMSDNESEISSLRQEVNDLKALVSSLRKELKDQADQAESHRKELERQAEAHRNEMNLFRYEVYILERSRLLNSPVSCKLTAGFAM
jgi:peptidoglycan hydrolase CwlO-like protein